MATTQGLEHVERSAVIEAPAREVWRMITDPAELSAWMGGSVELDARVGGAGRFALGEDGDHSAIVTRAEPERHLGLLWWQSEDGGQSSVDLELEPLDDERTLLRVTETRSIDTGTAQARASSGRGCPFLWCQPVSARAGSHAR